MRGDWVKAWPDTLELALKLHRSTDALLVLRPASFGFLSLAAMKGSTQMGQSAAGSGPAVPPSTGRPNRAMLCADAEAVRAGREPPPEESTEEWVTLHR